MKGKKRLSSSAAEINDSAFHNKRVIAGSPFDAQKDEPSQQKLTAKPALDLQRAEPSCQHVKALNTQFARCISYSFKLSRLIFYQSLEVRIARFLASVLGTITTEESPNELWQDGVQDYLTHALNIMEKFSDVVNWLKGNAVTGDSLSAAESYKNGNKVVAEIKNSEAKYFQEKTGFTPISTTTSFSPGTTTPSFSSGTTTMSFSFTTASFFSASPTTSLRPAGMTTSFTAAGSKSSFTFGGTTAKFTSARTTTSFTSSGMTTSFATPWSSGIQSSVAVNDNASDDADEENELPQPSSPSVKKSEEKGIVVVHEVKCKLYVKQFMDILFLDLCNLFPCLLLYLSTDPADKDSWKDKGTGQLSIKCKEGIGKGSKDSKPIIVVRNDVGKVLLNALLYPGIKTSAQKNSVVAIFHTSDDGGNNGNAVARTFLIRTKSKEDRNKLATVIQEYAPAS
ncbi:hypothetical protein ES332_A08G209300v1 [Gossypium tomentosum]|uniref:RanBD1 domain-containing protein n=1 Tax=Gossypium tomentosum TaxID=34277 RepID=A0A5D2PIK4_GOSTO|nr:hypothetical protein ES332_A08G209300v1 [Gossypium tomentosum]